MKALPACNLAVSKLKPVIQVSIGSQRPKALGGSFQAKIGRSMSVLPTKRKWNSDFTELTEMFAGLREKTILKDEDTGLIKKQDTSMFRVPEDTRADTTRHALMVEEMKE